MMQTMMFQPVSLAMQAGDWGNLIFYFVVYSIGFVLGAFGGMYSECSGIINIALEGSMVIGAFFGLFIDYIFGTMDPMPQFLTTRGGAELVILLGAVVAIIAGIIFSFLLTFVSNKLKADQTIVGTAMNTLATAICAIVFTYYTQKDSLEVRNNLFVTELTPNTDNVFLKQFFSNMNCSLIVGILAIAILWFIMDKTRFGLRLRACGENPAAADSVGINVNRMRYIGPAIGSAAAALGGYVIFSCARTTVWTITALGYGFLVLAIEILGNWHATTIFFASLLFGFFTSFSNVFTATITSSTPNVFTIRSTYAMLPYLLAFLILLFFSKHSHAPKSEGIPYDKSSR